MKKTSIGSWITLNHPSIAEVMGDSGFDWLCIDLEHTVTDFYETQILISTIQSKGIKAYVRVGENNSLIIKRVLDAGADGIIVPMINSLQDAKKAIEYIKYPPNGKRGVGLSRAQGYGFDFENYRDVKSKKIEFIAQIEHYKAIEELESIIQLDGVDGTFIGPYDLSGSIGRAGELDSVELLRLVKQYEEIAKKYNKHIGYHVVPIDYKLVQEKINSGYNFIAFGFDVYFLGSSIRDQFKYLNK
ncbi:aldolase/citrate lyase family protein [Flavobacteriaceae bacterium]|nr:aldolase/citrate lyase family protein [Flavobacteriaceae bacterium]